MDVDQSPLEFVLNLVCKLRSFPKAPLPLAVAFIDLHQLWNLSQILLPQTDSVYSHVFPFVLKCSFKGSTEVEVVDARSYLLQVHDS